MPRQSQPRADGSLRGRLPTSHERAAGFSWDEAYRHGMAPWDIGQPQPALVRVAGAGGFAGDVLDAGCGTGEHALHVAALGLRVLGVDVAETAIRKAREKATARGLPAEFAVADALQLGRLGRKFDTVLDCGLFHSFAAEERMRYAASLASAVAPGGTVYVLCFRDGVPNAGPHPVGRQELRAAFSPGHGWSIAAIEPEWIQATREYFPEGGAPAWLATMRRT